MTEKLQTKERKINASIDGLAKHVLWTEKKLDRVRSSIYDVINKDTINSMKTVENNAYATSLTNLYESLPYNTRIQVEMRVTQLRSRGVRR